MGFDDSGCHSSSRKASHDNEVDSLTIPLSTLLSQHQHENNNVPIVSSYNDQIRPLLDAVDKLRHLNVTSREGIQLPTIVVVGDQSSGKSSVLESLAGISLPRGQGICTRVPLIMRLQHHSDATPQLHLEYSLDGSTKNVPTDETQVADCINSATEDIAGGGRRISNSPLTLVVRKNGVPDLTMVDLPGITRIPVGDQPADIYDQVTRAIMEYIEPEESIILNVLSAAADFSVAESISMSKRVDKEGKRTLAVVTKVDMAPEGLLEKVTRNDVGIGLGYVCVKNRIGEEGYGEARNAEAQLFNTHPLLSKIDKSMAGIPVLAHKLVQIQAAIISRCLPKIVENINEKLSGSVTELSRMPRPISSIGEAVTTLMGIIGSSKESLRKLIVRGEFDEYPVDNQMHCAARLAEMLDNFSLQLDAAAESDPLRDFLVDEILVLEEAKGIWLPNFLSRAAFLALLQNKAQGISGIPVSFIDNVWNYVEGVVISVLMQRSKSYDQLQLSTRRACQNLIAKARERSTNWVKAIVEMEKLTGYTCNPEYMSEYNRLIGTWPEFKRFLPNNNTIMIPGFGAVTLGDAVKKSMIVDQAYDLKMRMTAYWYIVRRRLVDAVALHVQLSLGSLVEKQLEKGLVAELMGSNGSAGVEKMLEESPSVAAKREKLKGSVELLRESKEVLTAIMDRVATASSY